MNLTAIYNTWSDWELLECSIKNIRPLVDSIIIIASKNSNSGEEDKTRDFNVDWGINGCSNFLLEADPNLSLRDNETRKRNFGIDLARNSSHFLICDSDEFYEASEFLKEKGRFKNPDLNGLVCGLKCYFKSPKLSVHEGTLVPFIHKMTNSIKCDFNRNYPFAWDNKNIKIDPTRSFNITSGVEWSTITMHHMSWIRKDIKKKIRNSTARQNIENSTIVRDYVNAKPGYYCEYYRATLEECENLFNIPDIIDENLTSI